MPIRISHILRELEQKQNCRILFAAESGSRAWGLGSSSKAIFPCWSGSAVQFAMRPTAALLRKYYR